MTICRLGLKGLNQKCQENRREVHHLSNSICIGYNTGFSTTTGKENNFVGYFAGRYNETGSNNLFLGLRSGILNTSGSKNTYLGNNSGENSPGSDNVFIGDSAGFNEYGSNKLIIANSPTHDPIIWGDFSESSVVINGNNSHNVASRTFFVNGDAGGTTGWYTDSDARLKRNICTIPEALYKVLNLRGVNFEWINSENHEKGLQMGFIAQEVINVIPEVVDNSNGNYTMQYGPVSALLVEAIKEQQQQIESQKSEIENLQSRLEKIEMLLTKNNDE